MLRISRDERFGAVEGSEERKDHLSGLHNSKYEIFHLIIKGKIVWKRSIGRKRISWLQSLASSADLLRAAVSIVRIVMMLANSDNQETTLSRRRSCTISARRYLTLFIY